MPNISLRSISSGLGLILLAATTTTGSALAAAGVWDSAALGQSGTGTSSTQPWLTSTAPGSSYAEWNVILSYPSDNTPDIAGSGTLTELTGGAFVTSGGNVYGFAAPASFQLTLGGANGGEWDVYLRVATQGSIALASATLNGVSATRVLTYDNTITSGFGGAEQESLWKWTQTAALDGNWVFNFGASAAHMSLDQVAVYALRTTSPVPEPQTITLLIAGLAAVAALRSRRPAR